MTVKSAQEVLEEAKKLNPAQAIVLMMGPEGHAAVMCSTTELTVMCYLSKALDLMITDMIAGRLPTQPPQPRGPHLVKS